MTRGYSSFVCRLIEMPTIQLDQHTIHYHVKGTGPDVLMIHGWASSWRMWERPMHRLASAGFRAWALDLPGCGESEALCASNGRYTIANLTSVVEAFVERVGIESAALVGHSMGGAIALDMSHRRPDATRALVLVAPVVSGRLGLALHVFLGSPFGRRLLELSQHHDALARLGGRSKFAAPWLMRTLPLRAALLRDAQDLARTAPHAALGSLQAVIDFDFSDRLPEIRTPTLVIVGARDMTVPPSEGELAANKIPSARLVKLRGVGHQPVDECPEEFDRLLLDFQRSI
jgi:pimeloyl-ACP methyl ester carboxylesterase